MEFPYAPVRLIQGVRLIWGPLNTGFTVHSPFLCCGKKSFFFLFPERCSFYSFIFFFSVCSFLSGYTMAEMGQNFCYFLIVYSLNMAPAVVLINCCQADRMGKTFDILKQYYTITLSSDSASSAL